MIKIAIIGLGAMGSFFAGRLAPYAKVVMIGHWPAQLEAIRTRGLRLCHPQGEETVHQVLATHDVQAVGQADGVLVLVKSHQTGRAARQAAQILARDGVVVTLQNGLGNLAQIAAVVGAQRATLGVTSQGAMMMAPGLVRDTGSGPIHLALSPRMSPAAAAGLRALVEVLRQASVTVQVVPDVDSVVWGKLAVNAGINPLTALLRVPNGFLVQNQAARAIMCRAASEVAAVATAQGITLPYACAGQRALEVARATAANRSSMLQDMIRGAPTEIDAICGAIATTGQAHGVDTPINAGLYRRIKMAENGEPTPLKGLFDTVDLLARRRCRATLDPSIAAGQGPERAFRIDSQSVRYQVSDRV